MPELDRFEARFATAYRRYIEEALVEVDAAAIARRVCAPEARRRGFGPRSRWSARALAWLVLVALLLGLAVAGALLSGGRPEAFPAVIVASTAAPVASSAPTARPSPFVDLPPAGPSPAARSGPVGSGIPVVSWTLWRPRPLSRAVWLPPGIAPSDMPADMLANALPIGTDHGPVLLAGDNLMWRTSDGSWTSTPLPSDAYLPGASVGDELYLAGAGAAYRFRWSGSRWVADGRISGATVPSRPIDMAVGGDGRRVLLSDDGVWVSADGTTFVAASGDLCLASVMRRGDGFVGMGRPCSQTVPGDLDLSAAVPWTSSDGLAWARAASASPFGSGATVTDVATHGGRQVAVGLAPDPTQSGAQALIPAMWISDDGIAWRRLPTAPGATCAPWSCGGPASGFGAIAAGDAGWIAFTTGGRAWTSLDGASWHTLDHWPNVCAAYDAPLAAIGRDLIVVGEVGCQRGEGDEVAIGVVGP